MKHTCDFDLHINFWQHCWKCLNNTHTCRINLIKIHIHKINVKCFTPCWGILRTPANTPTPEMEVKHSHTFWIPTEFHLMCCKTSEVSFYKYSYRPRWLCNHKNHLSFIMVVFEPLQLKSKETYHPAVFNIGSYSSRSAGSGMCEMTNRRGAAALDRIWKLMKHVSLF